MALLVWVLGNGKCLQYKFMFLLPHSNLEPVKPPLEEGSQYHSQNNVSLFGSVTLKKIGTKSEAEKPMLISTILPAA